MAVKLSSSPLGAILSKRHNQSSIFVLAFHSLAAMYYQINLAVTPIFTFTFLCLFFNVFSSLRPTLYTCFGMFSPMNKALPYRGYTKAYVGKVRL